ncbi:N-acetylmuramoyl-L-alanine amidase-like domain-containing protein [Bdellovibrio bacteriovorus]|uniref:Putative ribosephosphate isomerase n=1 Tax=Bdellovibrio bacteriovorus (strain ATCC 15356 / DSM 50701 / NCIMB 9529 / HD100) TaxID=264462 RepID=Q6MQ80_BDEBA|nr:N-acetylmuramoyl-L-alanine amidase-like domain-containing protein [Bdellovibrio bacteriovorus]CAE78567.1 putative ribosephosphate isomerase [Bdellovibrio bacteriovorus HD100]
MRFLWSATMLSVSLMLFAPAIFATQSHKDQAYLYLQNIYSRDNVSKLHVLSLQQRLEYFSRIFLGKPYLGGALGEGANSAYDNDPLYRFDAFDCTTYVETVAALTLSYGEAEFQKNMNVIRYQDGVVSLITRNHFTSVDWNPNVEKLGILRDVTAEIGLADVSTLQTLIDKKEWYKKQASAMVKVKDNEAKKVGGIIARTQAIRPQISALNFLSKEILTAKPDLLLRFPKAGIVNIVRKNWNVRDAIGTNLDVSHQGIIFERDGEIIFRHASYKKSSQYVVEVPLLEYVKKNFGDQTFAGLNVLSFVGGL